MLDKNLVLRGMRCQLVDYSNHQSRAFLMYWSVLLLLFTVSWICSAEVMDGSGLRDMLLERVVSLESIECEYVYDATFKGVTYPPETFVFKNKGNWIWYEMRRDTERYSYEEGWSAFESETNINGRIDAFWIKQTGRKIYHTGLKQFMFLHYNMLSPLTIMGRSSPYSYQSHTETLRDFLGTAKRAYLEQTEPYLRLYLFHEPQDGNYVKREIGAGAIVHLDNTFTIHRVDYVMRPLCPFEEAAIYAPDKQPHTLYRLRHTDYFSDYLTVDGFMVPMKIKRIDWERSYSPEQLEQRKGISKSWETGMMGACEAEVKTILVPSDYIEESIYEINLRPETCRINNPTLTREDFTITQKDVNVYWDHVSGDYVNEDGPGNWYRLNAEKEKRERQRYELPFYRRRGNLVLLVSTILVLGSLSLLFSVYIIRKRR
jgi:hypothetical protein